MIAKIVAIFALLAVAFAAPSPNPAPEPKPQYLAYSAGYDYAYPSAYVPSVYSPLSAAAPLAYSAYPAVNTVYLKR